MAEEITIPPDISTTLGSLTLKQNALVGRVIKTLGEERTRELISEAQAIQSNGSTAKPAGQPATLERIFFELLGTRCTLLEQHNFELPSDYRPLSPAAQAIAEELGGVRGNHRGILNRLVETIGELATRKLMAEAAVRLEAAQANSPKVDTPKTVRAMLWLMLLEVLDPRSRSWVLQIPFKPPRWSPIHPKERARAIAERLNETAEQPIKQIQYAIQWLGADPVEAMVEKALQIEAEGGLMLPDGKRRRTLGGVFFHIMREAYPAALPHYKKKERSANQGPATPPVPQLPEFVWAERKAVYRELFTHIGELRIVKILLIGRPGKFVEKQSVVITSMRQMTTRPVPKHLPTPIPTTYSVYMTRKQWNKIKESIANPEDMLVVEGVASYDPDMEGIVVSATSVTTTMIQQSKRKPRATAEPADESASQQLEQ